MKIILKRNKELDEGSTLKVEGDFLKFLSKIYQDRFIDVVGAALKEIIDSEQNNKIKHIATVILASLDKEGRKSSPKKGKEILDAFKANKTGVGIKVAEVKSADLIKHILSSDIKTNIVKGRMSDEELEKKIKAFFKERNFNTIKLNLELVSRENPQHDYSGLYEADKLTLTVAVDARLLIGRDIEVDGEKKNIPPILSAYSLGRDYKKVVSNVEIAAESIPRSLRHEVQHFISDLFNVVLGLKQKIGMPYPGTFPDMNVKYDQFGRMLNARTGELIRNKKGEPILYKNPRTGRPLQHHELPVESSTNVEDAIDDFKTSFESYVVPKLAGVEDLTLKRDVINTLLRKFIGFDIDIPNKVKDIIGSDIIYFDNNYFKDIKSSNPKLWKWAVNKLTHRF